MTSNTFSVSFGKQVWGVLCQRLRRSLSLMGLFTAGILLADVMLMTQGLVNYQGYANRKEALSRISQMIGDMNVVFLIGMAIFSLILTAVHFSFLYHRRQGDVFHALPIREEALFLGEYLAEAVCLFFPMLLGYLVQALMLWGYGFADGGVFLVLGKSVALFLLLSLLMAAFYALPALCSGTVLECVASSLILTVLCPALYLGVYWLIFITIPGAGGYGSLDFLRDILFLLSPPFAGAFVVQPDVRYSPFSPWAIPFLVVLLAVLLVSCLKLSRKRGGEKTGDVRSYGPLKMALRILSSAAAGLVLGYILYRPTASTAYYYVGAALGTALTYLVTELFYFRTCRTLFRHLPGFAASAALLLVILTVVSFGLGLDTAMPEIDDLSYVTFTSPRAWLYSQEVHVKKISQTEEDPEGAVSIACRLTEQENLEKVLALNEAILSHKREVRYPYLPGDGDYSRYVDFHVSLHYYGKDGRTFSRNYDFPLLEESSPAAGSQQAVRRMAMEILETDEYAFSGAPLTTLDALESVAQTTWYPTAEESEKIDWEYRETRDVLELSKLGEAEKKGLLEKLEAALLSDYREGRCRDIQREDKDLTGTYVLSFPEGARFTAKDGWYGDEPAKGEQFILLSWFEYRVYPEMAETYALLEELHRTKPFEPQELDERYW